MKIDSEYKVIWPETTIFWGAGATASLGLPPTATMGKTIHLLGKGDASISDRISNTSQFRGIETELANFICMLGDALESYYADISDSENAAATALFSGLDAKEVKSQIVHWRTIYDWDALRRLIRSTPLENDDGGTFLNDLYNIIDGGIYNQLGVQVLDTRFSTGYMVLEPRRLQGARTLLNLLLQMMMATAYRDSCVHESRFSPYIRFAEMLSELMKEEGLHFENHTKEGENEFYTSRRFYLFSYAVISMNFDPILLWLIFNAHKNLNENPPYLGHNNRPMKLFHDFSHFLGVRKVKGKDPNVWYPFNETVVQRINGYEGRLGRIGKFYFPHGSTNFRECLNCGKLTATLGDDWNNLSETLFPSPPFKTKIFSPKARSKEEHDAISNFDYAAIQCPFCGHMTDATNIPMVMQSSFKGQHPSFIEEIQRDLKVCLANTKHVVLMGYSLPKDDVTWRSVIAAKRHAKQGEGYCSVVVGLKGPDEWMQGNRLTEWVKKIKDSNPYEKWPDFGIPAIDAAQAIFGAENVRAYTHGIPNVWKKGKSDVVELLYPKAVFEEGFPFSRE